MTPKLLRLYQLMCVFFRRLDEYQKQIGVRNSDIISLALQSLCNRARALHYRLVVAHLHHYRSTVCPPVHLIYHPLPKNPSILDLQRNLKMLDQQHLIVWIEDYDRGLL